MTTRPSSLRGTDLLIAQLGAHHRGRVRHHLMLLPAGDRQLRFGYLASDEAIDRYVRGIHFSRDAAFGAFDPNAELVGLGHLAFDRLLESSDAELGISVLPEFRRRGLGFALLNRAAEHGRNRGARRLMMAHVPGNTALAQLAHRASMVIQEDPLESRAYLDLGSASGATLVKETFTELMAALDLGFRTARAQMETATSA